MNKCPAGSTDTVTEVQCKRMRGYGGTGSYSTEASGCTYSRSISPFGGGYDSIHFNRYNQNRYNQNNPFGPPPPPINAHSGKFCMSRACVPSCVTVFGQRSCTRC